MNIKRVSVNRRHIPLRRPFKTALRTVTDIESIDVAIELDTGIVGFGSAAPTYVITGDSTESIIAALLGPIQNSIVGMDISLFEEVLKKVQTCCIANHSAKAAADIALHDAYAKMLNVPLYALFGGKGLIETDITVSVDAPDIMAQNAMQSVHEGFRTLKIKVGQNPELDIARVQAVRKQVPSHVRIRIDANQGWTPKLAVRLIREMEDLDLGIEFVEQPVVAHDMEGLKFVTDRVQTPIMADESLFSLQDAMRLVENRSADLLNIKLMKCGGLSQAKKIAHIAEANGIACMIGSMMESSLSVAAAAHLAASDPNILYYDLDAPLWLYDDPEGMEYSGNLITLHDGPGIGGVSRIWKEEAIG